MKIRGGPDYPFAPEPIGSTLTALSEFNNTPSAVHSG